MSKYAESRKEIVAGLKDWRETVRRLRQSAYEDEGMTHSSSFYAGREETLDAVIDMLEERAERGAGDS